MKAKLIEWFKGKGIEFTFSFKFKFMGKDSEDK